MLKSMGVSSHFWAKIIGGTVSPPPLARKTILAAEISGGDKSRLGGKSHARDAH
jgi:hypothetical protein